MSNQFTTQQIQAQFDSLPEDIKRVVSSSETATQIEEIGRQHDLRIDAIGVLIEYSTLIMLGLIRSNQFVAELVKHLSISREQAETIAVEIDSQVFSKIRNSLREVQYRPGTTSRFEESDMVLNTEGNPRTTQPIPAQTPQAVDTSALSAQDYNAEAFAQGVKTATPTRTAEATQPANLAPEPSYEEQMKQEAESTTNSDTVQATPQSSLDRFQETGFDEAETSVPLRNTEAHPQPTPDTASTVQPTPTTTNNEATTPAPAVAQANITDFRTRLEERMASVDNTRVNNDPYKESI